MVIHETNDEGSTEITSAMDNLKSVKSESGFAGTFLQNPGGPTAP